LRRNNQDLITRVASNIKPYRVYRRDSILTTYLMWYNITPTSISEINFSNGRIKVHTWERKNFRGVVCYLGDQENKENFIEAIDTEIGRLGSKASDLYELLNVMDVMSPKRSRDLKQLKFEQVFNGWTSRYEV
jgi:hypothetical protein